MATKRVAPKAVEVRRIPVRVGDVFGHNMSLVVVEELTTLTHATVRYVETGRRTRVQIRRLQREYPRAGEVQAAAAHRALGRLDKRLAAARKG